MLLTCSRFGWLFVVTKIWVGVNIVLVAELTLNVISFKFSFDVKDSFLLHVNGDGGMTSEFVAKLLWGDKMVSGSRSVCWNN